MRLLTPVFLFGVLRLGLLFKLTGIIMQCVAYIQASSLSVLYLGNFVQQNKQPNQVHFVVRLHIFISTILTIYSRK